MLTVKWFAAVTAMALFTSCSLIKGMKSSVSPYAERPECGPAGSWHTKKCFYEFEMTQMVEKTEMKLPPGFASGTIPKDIVERNKKESDDFDLIDPNKVPYFIYVFQVEGHSGNFTEKEIAHFVSVPNSAVLKYLGPSRQAGMKVTAQSTMTETKEDSFCNEVYEWIKNELPIREKEEGVKDYYKKSYDPSRDDKYIRECPRINEFFTGTAAAQ